MRAKKKPQLDILFIWIYIFALFFFQEEVVVPPIKNLSKQKSLTDRQQVCFSAFKIFLYQCKKQVPRS